MHRVTLEHVVWHRNGALLRALGKAQEFHKFPSEGEQRTKWHKNIAWKDLTINDKSPSMVACRQHFLPTDYASGCRIKKLLPGAVPTVFEGYPAYMVPPAKRPGKEPAPGTDVPLPNQIKRKAQPPESLPVEYNASLERHEDTRTMSTQTTNYDHQRASRYLSTISRLRSQVSYHRSKSQKLL
ncbi:hypothetical protein HPB50_027036 [Hyalomma asiaticum]|uniref:Uncharacterized protein n=1 Tax=Hyalomma asiaticum TaxID=266040 RepID=A0ACB7RS02_HYAAI|nr:hypothetical protein HPB50_027036 [Hyalomma asiaticum]